MTKTQRIREIIEHGCHYGLKLIDVTDYENGRFGLKITSTESRETTLMHLKHCQEEMNAIGYSFGAQFELIKKGGHNR